MSFSARDQLIYATPLQNLSSDLRLCISRVEHHSARKWTERQNGREYLPRAAECFSALIPQIHPVPLKMMGSPRRRHSENDLMMMNPDCPPVISASSSASTHSISSLVRRGPLAQFPPPFSIEVRLAPHLFFGLIMSRMIIRPACPGLPWEQRQTEPMDSVHI
jgi:hypothetical protein